RHLRSRGGEYGRRGGGRPDRVSFLRLRPPSLAGAGEGDRRGAAGPPEDRRRVYRRGAGRGAAARRVRRPRPAAPARLGAGRLRGGPSGDEGAEGQGRPDRKSTRLNSSHQIISYAVFCLKKKNKYK